MDVFPLKLALCLHVGINKGLYTFTTAEMKTTGDITESKQA